MEVKIVSTSQALIASLERYLNYTFLKEGVTNLIIVDVNTGFDSWPKDSGQEGFATVRKYAMDPKNVVIMIAIEREDFLTQHNKHFAALMTFANVGFLDVCGLQGLLSKYKEVLSGNKKQDETILALYDFEELQKNISVWRHGLDYIKRDPARLNAWLEKVRSAGFSGSDEEIVKNIENWKPETSGKFAGKYLSGIFVDAFETLFDAHWQLVPKVRDQILKLAENNQKTIFVISDSEQSLVESKLSAANISWRLMSKYDIRGASLELVVDNLNQNDFELTYQITAQKFINVADL